MRTLTEEALGAMQAAVKALHTQVAVAERLGVSAAAVNQLLKGTYRGDIDSMEKRIRGEFLQATVRCPVLGELNAKDCLDEQRRKPMFTNPLRVRLARACAKCPNRKEPGGCK